MYLALKLRDVPTRLIVYPDENHGLTVPSYLVHRMRSNIRMVRLVVERRAFAAGCVFARSCDRTGALKDRPVRVSR